ncbi:MAG: hypothetical protein HC880_10680 [Bacteroidia bacterium]|nr:hypothetical protein [Bacteroidia bacterium]
MPSYDTIHCPQLNVDVLDQDGNFLFQNKRTSADIELFRKISKVQRKHLEEKKPIPPFPEEQNFQPNG